MESSRQMQEAFVCEDAPISVSPFDLDKGANQS